MSPSGTFERVYAALKGRLRQGTMKPGERLEPAALSEDLFASVTPIRDALHRLVGERLVEAPRQEGFRVPLLSETRLRHLYAWHSDLLLLAIMRRRTAGGLELADAEVAGEGSCREKLRSVFAAIARSTGNPEHIHALDSVSERLEPVEPIEDLMLDQVELEADAICAAIRARNTRLLRKLLVNYHRRRERIIPELLARLELD